jgi:hypothetical protein
VVAFPHLFARPPRPERAAELVRGVRLGELSAELVSRLPAARSRADSVALGRAYSDSADAARARRFASVRVRTSWLSPLLARSPRYLVEARERAGGPAEYYLVRGPLARRSSRARWMIRFF